MASSIKELMVWTCGVGQFEHKLEFLFPQGATLGVDTVIGISIVFEVKALKSRTLFVNKYFEMILVDFVVIAKIKDPGARKQLLKAHVQIYTYVSCE